MGGRKPKLLPRKKDRNYGERGTMVICVLLLNLILFLEKESVPTHYELKEGGGGGAGATAGWRPATVKEEDKEDVHTKKFQ